jgi:hypothetical protein
MLGHVRAIRQVEIARQRVLSDVQGGFDFFEDIVGPLDAALVGHAL